jgi:2-polyprenyl-3-methyl-5-hydroxy-6-metoxy-1,4-benzoquinol methylase
MTDASLVSRPADFACQSCSVQSLREIEGFAKLPRVTSDSKPYPPGGRIFVCGECGLVQKIADKRWQQEAAEIYRDYDMYHQSTSNDQVVFDAVTGRPSGRCEVLTRNLLNANLLPKSGSLLDVGAGSGAMLAAFSAIFDGWRLYGLDLDDRKEPSLKSIPRFEKLFTLPPEQLVQKFDLITLIHSLEHFSDPLRMLETLKTRLTPSGRILIEVNNVAKTHFDMIVADHLCHFTPDTLGRMLERAGFKVEVVKTDWINKEISMLALVSDRQAPRLRIDTDEIVSQAQCGVTWLENMLRHSEKCAHDNQFGIFGTSVAATWLASGLGDTVKFFVDEDPGREGRTHLGKPILKPSEVPAGATVYLAFVPEVAKSIERRLAGLPVIFAAPL